MNVEVQLFAVARQITGDDKLRIELSDGATIADLRKEISRNTPELSDLIKHARFAVDQEYAADSTILLEESQVACIPPVSGG